MLRLILRLWDITCSLLRWFRAIGLEISLIELLVWDAVVLWRPVVLCLEALAVVGRILFAVLVHTLDSSSSRLLCLYRSRVVSTGSFLSRVWRAIAEELGCIFLVIANLLEILRRRGRRTSKRLRRSNTIIIWHNNVVDDVFESPSWILLRGVLRRQPTCRFALLQLRLFQFWQVGFLI